MAFGPHIAVRPLRFGRTARRDRWWAQGLLVFTALSTFVGYTASAAWTALSFPGFGIAVGTLILAATVVFLGGYAFGCHSLRHLAGGCFDQLSTRPLHERAYACVGCLNRRHGTFAWLSLFSVAFADLYIRLCSMGVWHDWRIV